MNNTKHLIASVSTLYGQGQDGRMFVIQPATHFSVIKENAYPQACDRRTFGDAIESEITIQGAVKDVTGFAPPNVLTDAMRKIIEEREAELLAQIADTETTLSQIRNQLAHLDGLLASIQ